LTGKQKKAAKALGQPSHTFLLRDGLCVKLFEGLALSLHSQAISCFQMLPGTAEKGDLFRLRFAAYPAARHPFLHAIEAVLLCQRFFCMAPVWPAVAMASAFQSVLTAIGPLSSGNLSVP